MVISILLVNFSSIVLNTGYLKLDFFLSVNGVCVCVLTRLGYWCQLGPRTIIYQWSYDVLTLNFVHLGLINYFRLWLLLVLKPKTV